MSSSHELCMSPQLQGIGLPRDITESTSQVGHVCLPRLRHNKILVLVWENGLYQTFSTFFPPISSTNRILHAFLYRDIQVTNKIVPCLLELSNDPICRCSKQMEARWMLEIRRFIPIIIFLRSSG